MDFLNENEIEFLPWLIEDKKTEKQISLQKHLIENENWTIGENCFISEISNIYQSKMAIGNDTIIAAKALIRDANITMGNNCSVNSYAYLQGNITIGNDVRIAPKVSIIAVNHGYSNLKAPIVHQSSSSKGIVIGDNVWIGANSVILDGVTIGSNSIIGAGSVVTHNVDDFMIVGGNPAKVIKNRIEDYYAKKLISFCDKTEGQIERVTDSYIVNGEYVDNTIGQSYKRAWCDTVEILAMFQKQSRILEPEALIEKLQFFQVDKIDYEVLSVGYATEVLGTNVKRPYTSAVSFKGEQLIKELNSYDWKDNVWKAGSDVDCLGTAFYQNLQHFNLSADLETLFSWLNENVNEKTGMWGDSDSLLQIVNGFYRLIRGTYAQFNIPLQLPEKAIDTLLLHANNPLYFSDNNGTSCNVLDIIHPLWLCKKQTNYRYSEGVIWALDWIDKILDNWVDNKGFCFDLLIHDVPTLMGTEMWLSILFLLCDYVGISHLLSYEPKGVHRLSTVIQNKTDKENYSFGI